MRKSYFANKNILITGISGFVGSHLAKHLTSKGANIFGVSRSINGKTILHGDIQNYDLLNSFVHENKIQICFHLAAESLVESGQEDPYQTFKTNTLGTLNILESARKNKLERIIIASTSHVYGDNPLPYKEIYPPKPSRPYETSKTCIDLISQSYADTFGLPVLIPRFSNIYGPGDLNFNRLIPKTIKSVLRNEPPKMWGGSAIRDYIYIDDAINGYLKLAAIPMSAIEKNRLFNFGTGNRMSVKQVMERIIKMSGKTLSIEKVEDTRDLEIHKQYVSSAKAKKVLKWRPMISFEKGLGKTMDWYQKTLENSV
jgi:CDP-glucose 4,6-dehydratase